MNPPFNFHFKGQLVVWLRQALTTRAFPPSVYYTSLVMALVWVSASTGYAQPNAKRLKALDAYVTAAMKTWDVPGLSLAIIRNGEIILNKGYGLRDIEKQLPVSPKTAFAIGSSSKAFTALAVAMLVEDGLIEWDEPVKTYLPDFEMWDEFAEQKMTSIDLLSHVSGLPRHDIAWYGSPRTREELFLALQHLEPTTSFRGSWQYQNLMFMTAGVLIEKVSGKSWEAYVQERILDPLGMTSSSLSLEGLIKHPEAAKGYEKGEADFTLLPYRNIDAIGPAGSINSTSEDMAKWVTMLLRNGQHGGEEVAEARSIAAVFSPRAIVPSSANEERFYQLYGLGWFITSYKGHLMVEHGGNIDGFSAGVCLLPQDSIGIVVLTNRNGTPITTVLEYFVTDILLDLPEQDWSKEVESEFAKMKEAMAEAEVEEEEDRIPNTRSSLALADYVGTYLNPGYGSIDISLPDSQLLLQYNGLDLPLRHFHYDVFVAESELLGKQKVQFVLNMKGEVDRLESMLQPGMANMIFQRETKLLVLEVATLEEFVGAYSISGVDIVIGLREGELTMTVPGQPTYTLDPVKQDEFNLRDLEGFSVVFSRDEAGAIISITSVQPNGRFKAMKR